MPQQRSVKRNRILPLFLSAAVGFFPQVALSAERIVVPSFQPPQWCSDKFGSDIEAGLRGRIFEIIDASVKDKSRRNYRIGNMLDNIIMLNPRLQDIERALAVPNIDKNVKNIFQLKKAAATQKWGFGYDSEIAIRMGLTGAFNMAREEAKAKGQTQETIVALKLYDEAVLAKNDADIEKDYLAKKLREEKNFRNMLGVTVLRELISLGHDAAAEKFLKENDNEVLEAYHNAMMAGRNAGFAELDLLLSDVGRDAELNWATDYKQPYWLAAEFVFQAIAAKRWEMADQITKRALSPKYKYAISSAGNLREILIERRDEEALLFLMGLYDANQRKSNSFDDMDDVLALRGDVDTLEKLDAYLRRSTSSYMKEPEDSSLLRARIVALVRNREFEKAASLAGDKSFKELGATYAHQVNKKTDLGLRHNSAKSLPALISIYGNEKLDAHWTGKMTPKQRQYFKMFGILEKDGWKAVRKFIKGPEGKQLFSNPNAPIRPLRYLALNSAFEVHHKNIEPWFKWGMEKPAASARYLDEWSKLARLKCTGWAVKPFHAFEHMSHGYFVEASAMGAPSGYFTR